MLTPLVEHMPLCVVQQVSALCVVKYATENIYHSGDLAAICWVYDTMPQTFWKCVAPWSCSAVQPEKFIWMASLEASPTWMRVCAAFLQGRGDIDNLGRGRDRDIMMAIGHYGDAIVYDAACAKIMQRRGYMEVCLSIDALRSAIDARHVGMIRHICKNEAVLLGTCEEYYTGGIIRDAAKKGDDVLRVIFDSIGLCKPAKMIRSLSNNPDAIRLILSWVPAEARRAYILDVIGGHEERDFAELMMGELARAE